MKLIFPARLVERLRAELRRAGNREIGGVLVGEYISAESFRVADVSVQRSGGTASHFVRDVEQNWRFLEKFFAETGNDYRTFNYLGEWHSHPSFEPLPSGPDINTMRDIVRDPRAGVNFAVLVIASLKKKTLELSATVFTADGRIFAANIQLEPALQEKPFLRRFIDLFRL
jgi:[CysO sulfur-carrier protein]-S-L-cysteine hydrolase